MPGVLSILHLNSYDAHAGAERLISDLGIAQKRAGHRVRFLVGVKADPGSEAVVFDRNVDFAYADACHRASLPDYELRGSDRLKDHPLVREADVLHAHNLGGFIHQLSMAELSQTVPTVWTIHDMLSFTGYCHHSLGCGRWRTGCGECPDLNLPGLKLYSDTTAFLWRHKKTASEHSRLQVVGPSAWMTRQLRDSLLGCHPLRHIPNGIDTTIFHVRDREECRARLGLPLRSPIVAGMARGGPISHPFKGGRTLGAVVSLLQEKYPDLLFLNIGAEPAEGNPRCCNVVGRTREEVAELLCCADIFIYPSIADTAPLAVMEAQSCGLPVVGSRVGGISESVRDNTTGFLCAPDDVEAFLKHCVELLDNPNLRRRFSVEAQAHAREHFSILMTASGYEVAYREGIADQKFVKRKAASHAAKVVAALRDEARMTMGKSNHKQPRSPSFGKGVGTKEFMNALLGALLRQWRRIAGGGL